MPTAQLIQQSGTLPGGPHRNIMSILEFTHIADMVADLLTDEVALNWKTAVALDAMFAQDHWSGAKIYSDARITQLDDTDVLKLYDHLNGVHLLAGATKATKATNSIDSTGVTSLQFSDPTGVNLGITNAVDILWLVKSAQSATTKFGLRGYGNAGTTPAFEFSKDASDRAKINFRRVAGGASVSVSSGTDAWPDDAWFWLRASIDFATGAIKLWVNTTEFTATHTDTGATCDWGADLETLALGLKDSTGFEGSTAAFVIFNAVKNPADIAAVKADILAIVPVI